MLLLLLEATKRGDWGMGTTTRVGTPCDGGGKGGTTLAEWWREGERGRGERERRGEREVSAKFVPALIRLGQVGDGVKRR